MERSTQVCLSETPQVLQFSLPFGTHLMSNSVICTSSSTSSPKPPNRFYVRPSPPRLNNQSLPGYGIWIPQRNCSPTPFIGAFRCFIDCTILNT